MFLLVNLFPSVLDLCISCIISINPSDLSEVQRLSLSFIFRYRETVIFVKFSFDGNLRVVTSEKNASLLFWIVFLFSQRISKLLIINNATKHLLGNSTKIHIVFMFLLKVFINLHLSDRKIVLGGIPEKYCQWRT